jgi:RHS repeat-associated protein
MFLVKRKQWFKASAAVTAASMVWLSLAGTADAAPTRAWRGLPVGDVAVRLGVDRGTLDGSAARDPRAAAERRARALEKLATRTRQDDRVAAVERDAAAIRRVHAPELLAGVARAAAETRRAAPARAADAASSTSGARLRAAATGIRAGLDRAQRGGALTPALRSAAGTARRLAEAADEASRPGATDGSAREVERLAPPHRPELDTRDRRPKAAVKATPPPPRERVRLGVAPAPEQREFYASILDAPGATIETEVGPVDPALVAAGMAPAPRLALAADALDLDALLAIAAGALPAPDAPDLADGPDASITPAIREKAAGLGNDPLAIYRFVHDELDAEPYYGAKRGSTGAWEQQSGNDADLSALLVALLRAANVPARFEYGTVDLTPAQAMAWTGTTDLAQAADALFSGGIPTLLVDAGGRWVVRVEHVWVRAWVPYTNYRGAPRAGSRGVWVRLDPTLKRARLRPATNLRGKVDFDYARLLSRVSSDTALSVFEAQLRGYAQANGIPCRTIEDFIAARERIADGLTVLPAELPAPIHGALATFAALPAAMRHSVTIALGGMHVAVSLPEVYGAALTVRYRGATPADEALIAAAGGVAHLAQPSAVRIVPVLEVNGAEIGRGVPAMAGVAQEMLVQISSPHHTGASVRHRVYAGSVFAIGFPTGVVPSSVVERHELAWSRVALGGGSGDDLEAARGQRALWRYFWQVTRDWERIFGLEWARVTFGVSEGIAGRRVSADALYDVPVAIRPGTFVIDVPHLAVSPYMIDGQQRDRLASVFELAGYDGSTWEHLVWEETVHHPSISTVRVLQAARQEGQQLRTLTASDAAVVPALPFSAAARDDIADALHAGLVVTLSERPVTWGGYANAEGYVLKDPRTGAADFRIFGLYSGGASNGVGDPKGPACDCTGDRNGGSLVNLADGRMHFSETDLVVPARGIPVAFARRFNSASPYGGRLGPHWQHTYEVRIVREPDGAVTFVDDELLTQTFARASDGSFVTPAGSHSRLFAAGDGFRLVFKDGNEYRFGADGQLIAIQDPNDHLLLLRYDAGRLSTVTDATSRVALTFEYDAASGLLSSVTDPAGRRVRFVHDAGDLVRVTDVLGHEQRYAYDSAHQLTSKTDRNGNVTEELYDGVGRWVGSRDPAGFGRSVSYDMLNRRTLYEDKTGALTVYEYNENGRPLAVTDPAGNRTEMRWDGANNKLWEKDARGNETSFTYDASGNLETRTDAAGITTRYTYDGNGRVLTVVTAGRRVAENTYDARGNLDTRTDAAGKVTRYTYTPDGLPETITQPGGAVTRLSYHPDGTVRTVTDGENGTTELAYDAYGHLRSIKDPLNSERTLVADAAGRIEAVTDALRSTTTFEYDREGNRTAVIDADRRRTTFAYDALHRVVTVTDASRNTTRTTYDPEGRVLSRTDPLGRTTTHRYDVSGRLVETTDAAGASVVHGYCADVSSQPCATVDALGNYSEVEFDALGRPTTTVDASGNRSTQHYDAFGRRDRSVVAGQETRFEYDDAGHLARVIDALQGATEYGYDDRGNRTSVKDANGAVTSFGYDRANRLAWERTPIQAVGQETRYEYDAAGNRRLKTDGNGARTEYVYDANRRLRAVLFADGSRYDFDYDARGNRTLEKSGTHERALSYDALGRLSRVEDRTLGRVMEYGYDAAGQRERMTLDSGETVRYRWDPAGRLLETVDPQGQTTRFVYDAAGRRTGTTFGNGTRATYGYDAVGQVTSIAYLDPRGQVQSAFGYGYDAAGNRSYKAFADGNRERYGYDPLNRLTSAEYPPSPAAPSGRRAEYAYDPVGNRKQLLDTARPSVPRYPVSARASSEYRSSGQASAAAAVGPPDVPACSNNTVSANHWFAGFEGYSTARDEWLELTYANAERARGVRVHETSGGGFVMRVDVLEEDGTAHTVYEGGDKTACGGWLEVWFAPTAYAVKKVKVYTRFLGSEGIDTVALETPAVDRYEYNGFNQLLSVTPSDGGAATRFAYDGNGNQTSRTDASGVTQYVYNPDNRLVGISLPGGGSNAFEYDANGLRTKKTDSAGTTRYLLDGLSVIAQYAPDGQRQAWYTQSLARIDEVLNVANDSGKFWYQADALGSVYGLTNQAGALIGSQNYDVFGAPTPAPSGPAGQPFGFTGREHELDSGLVYARARYLDPALGRWTQADPLPLLVRSFTGVPMAAHEFAYAHANPALFTDPSGKVVPLLAWILVLMGIIAGLPNDDDGFTPTGAVLVTAGIGVGAVGALACGSRIIITEDGLAHVIQRHTINNIAKFANKSKFLPGEDIVKLVLGASGAPMLAQASGNFARVIDAGRAIGIDRATGLPTSIYTVITTVENVLVTAFPGMP